MATSIHPIHARKVADSSNVNAPVFEASFRVRTICQLLKGPFRARLRSEYTAQKWADFAGQTARSTGGNSTPGAASSQAASGYSFHPYSVI
jgi:hypothetical protein